MDVREGSVYTGREITLQMQTEFCDVEGDQCFLESFIYLDNIVQLIPIWKHCILLAQFASTSIHITFICLQILNDVLRKLKIEHVVWCKDKADMFYEVSKIKQVSYFVVMLPVWSK